MPLQEDWRVALCPFVAFPAFLGFTMCFSQPPALRCFGSPMCHVTPLLYSQQKSSEAMPGKLLVGFFNTAKANNNIKLFIICITFKVLAFKVRV